MQEETLEAAGHLAGIVPVGAPPLDFGMPWHDCLMPISQNYLAVERAVYQCALAGCRSIWLTGHRGSQPLIRERVGDSIMDPVTLNEKHPAVDFMTKRPISIFYVSIDPFSNNRRDSLGWSVLYGSRIAFKVSQRISKWIAPDKYFVSFPYGIVPDEQIRNNRALISSKKGALFVHNGKNIKDGTCLPFTFGLEDYERCRKTVIHKLADDWGDKKTRFYGLSEVFSELDISSSHVIDLPWYHEISNWEGYKKYMSSEQCGIYEKPKKLFTGKHRDYNEYKGKFKNE